MKPCVSSVASVRNTLLIGSFATRTIMPCRCASPSFSPTRASGGSVNMQYGTSRSRVLRCPPADIAAYLKAYKAEGYEVHAVRLCKCHCGSTTFELEADRDEGCAQRTCAICRTKHLVCDSADYWEDAQRQSWTCTEC